MPTVDEQRTTALAKLRLWVQATVEPTLGEEELGSLLDAHRRATIWAMATAYTYGQVVIPTVRNGHRYRCIQAGTSGATQPTWPTAQAATIADGTSSPALRWQEDGVDFENVYDVRHAIHDGWMLKASKASEDYDIRQGGLNDHSRSQIYQHCLEMAAKFAPVGVA